MRPLLLILLFSLFQSEFPKPDSALTVDVCIYGGTSAGVIAAYAAAKMGKKVVLIEPGKHLGGLSTGGLGYTDIGNKYAITGVARDFYRRIGRHYGKFEQWIFEPHVAEEIFNQYVREAKINVLYYWRVVRVNKKNNLIVNIKLENPLAYKEKIISAKMFIDCSYEGDLMALAGVSYIVGRESNEKYNETYNGIQLMEGHQFPDDIDPYKERGNPESGLLWGISDNRLGTAGTGDLRVQAYNYRICLTNEPSNRLPLERPSDYDSTKYELLLRLFEAQPTKRRLNDYFIFSMMPNHKTDINNRGGFSTDMIGMSDDYPNANYANRIRIIYKLKSYTQGLLYFYANDPRVPEQLRNEMHQWGYPKDEYIDNGHWSPQPYIREARRMVGSYVMTQANCVGKENVRDGIALAAYTMDSHNCQRIVVNGMVKNEGNVEVGGFGPYLISYRAIIPKSSECTNLFVPVCLSASHIAYGSIRMEPVFMALAEAAAVAASIAIDRHQIVQEVSPVAVQEILKSNPLMNGTPPEILVDNDDSSHVVIKGNWKEEKTGGYGPSYLFANKDSASEVQFFTNDFRARTYDVYVYIPKRADESKKVHITIQIGNNKKLMTIDQAAISVEGQTTGEWVSLGAYLMQKGSRAHVTISGNNEGTVVADAVLFVPKQ